MQSKVHEKQATEISRLMEIILKMNTIDEEKNESFKNNEIMI